MKGKKAIEGTLKRMEERLGNDLPDDKLFKLRQESENDWNNWPDWNNDSDFPNWENLGGDPPS